MSAFGARPPVLTETLKEALQFSFGLASQACTLVDPSQLMHGLIETRSVAVPILDSLGVDVSRYSKALVQDVYPGSGLDWTWETFGRHMDHFDEELDTLTSHPRCCTPYLLLQLAQTIAKSKRQRVVDSACFLHALFRDELNEGWIHKPADLKRVAETPIGAAFREFLLSDRQEVSACRVDVVDGLVTVDNNVESGFLSGVFAELVPYLSDVAAFERMDDAIALARSVEPYAECTKIALLPGKYGIHARQFGYLNTYGLIDGKATAPCKVNTVSGAGVLTWEMVQKFERLINRAGTTEWDLQKFFERYPMFLLGSQYQRLHSQVALVKDDGTELIPDFFAERVGTCFGDIIELKKPNARLLSGAPGRKGMAASLTRALNQMREYRNYFDDALTRRRFHAKYGFEAFRPAIIVVIGRSSDYLNHIERTRIEDEYRNMQILTYDDILQRAKRLIVSS